MPAGVVSILGCGWLGFPLAKKLIASGYSVKGSTTTAAKKSILQSSGIIPFQLQCDPEVKGDNPDDFFSSDILFLNIPFRRNLADPRFYQSQIESVVRFAERSSIKSIIFTSSTSIYPDNNSIVAENSNFKPDNPRAQVLWDVEESLRNNRRFSVTILRLAGLYGGERKIGQFLAGQKSVEGGKTPVNLVHLNDCVAAIDLMIRQGVWGETFNVCSDSHPLREQLYTQAAEIAGLPVPQFVSGSAPKFKIVSNKKLKEQLGYEFQHPDPMTL
jgi:nucleoside-diphosphate-sugar epimerase